MPSSYQGGIVQSALVQIASGFRMVMELELVKGGCLPQQLGNGSGRQFQFEKRHRLAERQIEEELGEAVRPPPRPEPWQRTDFCLVLTKVAIFLVGSFQRE